MRHYLDYAATSALRPPVVTEAVTRFLAECGATPGRGAYAEAVEAARVALRCRRAVQEVLALPGGPERVAFASNATQALNTALYGLLRPGDVVVTTPFEHNAVLRPLAWLERSRGVRVRIVRGAPDGSLDVEGSDELLDGARLLAVTAVSNVLGTRLPVGALAARARAAGALVLVDTAQGAGHVPMHPADEGADLVAFTGHKGLLGPQGTGGLWVREGVEVAPLLRGGGGGDSADPEMPRAMPDRLEAGTLNGVGLAGLEAGITYLLREGIARIHRRTRRLKYRLREGLSSIPGVTMASPAAPDGAAIVTVTLRGVSASEVAARLDREWGVAVRAGLHCAPGAHRVLGTLAEGAVRFSLGWASQEEDVDRAIEGIAAIAGGAGTMRATPGTR